MPREKPFAGTAAGAVICPADPPRSIRSIRPCMFAAKSRISTAETSLIMPRPYCAAAPAGAGQRGRDDHAGLAPSLLVGAVGVHDDAPGRLIALGDIGGARELQPDRAHPD